MGGDLLIPRCEVYWGDENITFFKGAEKWPGSDGPQPLVYNVKVSIHEEGQTPSGSMSWNPSALAYKEYERLVKEKYDQTIVVKYYYPGGPSIAFSFVWAGQTESYGRNMDITVRLMSELEGLTSSKIKNIAIAGDGISLSRAIDITDEIFGLQNLTIPKNPSVERELKKVKVLSNYTEGTSYSQSIENVVGQNGNLVFLSNIQVQGEGSIKGIIFPPYSWEGRKLQNGQLVDDPETQFDSRVIYRPPTKNRPVFGFSRYGYFLGPSIIDSMSKTSEWSPNQKTRRNTKSTSQKLSYKVSENSISIDPGETQRLAAADARSTNGSRGSYGSISRPGMRLEGNEDGEFKKELLQRERTAKLSTNLFMCPALTGIKPCDIIFIPSYSGESMEDWIVNSVEYEQSDGGVNISIQASREFALGRFMNPWNGLGWLKLANEFGLVGKYGSIENWVRYAWSFESLLSYEPAGPDGFKLKSTKPTPQPTPTNSNQPPTTQPQPTPTPAPTNPKPIPAPEPTPKPLGRALTAPEQREFNSAVVPYPGNKSLVKVSKNSAFYRYLTRYNQKPKQKDPNSVYDTFNFGMVIANQWFEYYVAERLF
jgi:hypothetical protein